jgi:hypothetical protein
MLRAIGVAGWRARFLSVIGGTTIRAWRKASFRMPAFKSDLTIHESGVLVL